MREQGKKATQQQEQEQLEPAFPIDKHQVLAVSGTLLATGLAEAATHNPVVLAGGLLAAIAAGKLTPAVRAIYQQAFVDPEQLQDMTEKFLDRFDIEDNSHLPQDPMSKMKRLFGKGESEAQPKEASAENTVQRRMRGAKALEKQGLWIPPQFELTDVLDAVRAVNKRGEVYFGDSEHGAVSIHLTDMYHVFDVSSSGKGKSNRFRLGMMQMVNTCETYFINPLANNIKATKDERKIEVWKPIFDRLANGRPMKTAEEIKTIMAALIKEIQTRKEQEAAEDLSWQEKPIFVFVDELPEIFDLCPEAVKMLDKIGRTGRQFYVFCWVASQSAAVEDIGQSTATQAQYKTRLYGGGDRNSSNRLMKGPVSVEYEQMLQTQGAGLTLMLAEGFVSMQCVRSPLVSNEALFDYFGLPPFNINEWLPAEKKSLPSMQRKNALDLSQTVSQGLSQNLSHVEKEPIHAQNVPDLPVKGERRERVKGPNEEGILEAMDALESDGKALTMNAIAKKAGLTWRSYEEIEVVALYYGYDLSQGKGRPAEK